MGSARLGREEITVRFPADPASLAHVRREVAHAASAAGLEPERIQGLQIACGEAATNAVEHAYDSDAGDILVRTFRSDDHFWVEIKDHGRWREPAERGSGRGMAVMRAFVDEVDIRRDNRGTTVRLAVRMDRQSKASKAS
ncbi:MAG TPA: ATP-binding protein [bacterium]|nr:ATP-binding protein [bacterium]